MTARNLATLLVRLLGLYCLIQALPHLQTLSFVVFAALTSLAPPTSEEYMAVLALLSPLLLMLAAGALFTWAPGISRRIVPGNPDASWQTSASAHEIQSMAFAVVGVVIVAQAIPSVFTAIGGLIVSYEFAGDVSGSFGGVARAWAAVTASVLQLLIGIGLFLGARGLSLIWHRLRTAGLDSTNQE